MSERGNYLVIEGPDGTGKTTQAQLLVEELGRRGMKSRYVHEPGETAMGLELEKIIKNREIGRSALTDLHLFTANRIEVYQQVIAPALENGETVVADRNWLSSVAYQGIAGGLGAAKVRERTQQDLPDEYVYPTFTTLLHVSDARRQEMLGNRGTSGADYFETKPDEFQRKVEKGYEIAGQMVPADHSVNGRKIQARSYVSAEGTIEEVHARILQKLEDVKVIPKLREDI